MKHIRRFLSVRCPDCKGANNLLRGAAAAHDVLLKVYQAFDKENRRDITRIKIVQKDGLVHAQAF
jgi:hypothetical protein